MLSDTTAFYVGNLATKSYYKLSIYKVSRQLPKYELIDNTYL